MIYRIVELLEEFLGPLIWLALLAVPFVLFSGSAWMECRNLEDMTKSETRWRFFGGCYIERDGVFIPADRWINLEEVGK